MKLIVGLGNPGPKYQNNRHNVGFWVVDRLAQWNNAAAWTSQFEGLLADSWIAGQRVLLLKPATYMNRSGQSVRRAFDFYKLDTASVLVICDDLALAMGKIRLRPSGSSGGNNGLKDIFAHLGTEEVPRLRVGIGTPEQTDAADFVLSDFRPDQRELIDKCVTEAGRAAECWCREGMASAMNQFNGIDIAKE